MRFRSLVTLLTLQCCYLLALTDAKLYINTESLPVAATINFKGSSLRVFEFNRFQVAEPRISFGDTCDSLKFSYLYQKYQLTLPINIDVNALQSPTERLKTVGQITITDLQVKTDDALANQGSKLMVIARLKKTGQAQLIFLCETFLRCQQLKDEVVSNPEDIQESVKFVLFGRISGNYVKFGAVSSANAPRFDCNPGQWVVFQRRVDGNLSFAQNWDAYVKGFGNPESNYWMGLHKLSAMTITNAKNDFPDTARCKLRIETQDWRGNAYWGEYGLFQVLGAEQNYRLHVGQEVAGSQLVGFISYHNGTAFSTFERDNDKSEKRSCSQSFGYGGWWYQNCHTVNLNGAYTTDNSLDNAPVYSTIYIVGKHRPMRRTVMKFRCN